MTTRVTEADVTGEPVVAALRPILTATCLASALPPDEGVAVVAVPSETLKVVHWSMGAPGRRKRNSTRKWRITGRMPLGTSSLRNRTQEPTLRMPLLLRLLRLLPLATTMSR